MSASEINQLMKTYAPAGFAALSEIGRNAVFPKGIPFQAASAKGAEINATIGQLTDGAGGAMPLSPILSALSNLEQNPAFLYAPVSGPTALRQAWGARERRQGGEPSTPSSLPIVTHGLTHGLSIVADLFADEETDVIVPAPCWGNYNLIFRLHHQARIVSYPFFRDGRFNVEGLADCLAKAKKKAIVVLNFPGNPTGYLPAKEEEQGIVDALHSANVPVVAVVDDAYQGWVYEPGRMQRSLFWSLLERGEKDKVFPVKIDGATKELVFFSSRVGFLTHGAAGPAQVALESKIKCIIRGTVGSASGPAMTAITQALGDANRLDGEFERVRKVMAGRYNALRSSLATFPFKNLTPQPFNSAYFALFRLHDGLEAEQIRVRLLEEKSVGTIAFAKENALRVAYCSITEAQVPVMMERMFEVVG